MKQQVLFLLACGLVFAGAGCRMIGKTGCATGGCADAIYEGQPGCADGNCGAWGDVGTAACGEGCDDAACCGQKGFGLLPWMASRGRKKCTGAECGLAEGPTMGAVTYPYYTVRGPRDFLVNNPPSIGR